MGVNVSIPKGTRDFSPVEMSRRKYIFDTIENIFRLYGYLPIETPAMENLSTLLGKYGEEGDKLIYQIRSNKNLRDHLSKEKAAILDNIYPYWLPQKSEIGLRYDLTVPFARFVVMHQNELSFPFKRYQIQPVWRADRPQKGRYREFYQCDVDIIGSNSLINEVELIQIIVDIFQKLGLQIIIKLNNRKILSGLAEIIGEPDKMMDIAIAIDKAEKMGWDEVKEELKLKGLNENSISTLFDIFKIGDVTGRKVVPGETASEGKTILEKLAGTLEKSSTGSLGINEVSQIINLLGEIQPDIKIDFDPTLARGLDYYTGAIIEVKAKDVSMGSICGGGRYDDLTGIFGLPHVSGVGVSFGADRIYDVLDELKLFPEKTGISTQLLFVNFGKEEEKYALLALAKLRKAGICAELYPDGTRLKKQFAYADAKKIPWVAIAGTTEMTEQCFKLRDMTSGEEKKASVDEIICMIKK
ncbi:MAG TPA: histidine--tRNA ligase [Bacteroidales bacterium]|nr:histidine--tRNA ligase [Bacteroidales bacterium]